MFRLHGNGQAAFDVHPYGGVPPLAVSRRDLQQTIGFCVSGALQGAGDTKTPLYITFASMWGVRVLGIMICVHLFHLGQYAICVCMCTDNVVRCLLFLLQYKKKRAILAQKAMAR